MEHALDYFTKETVDAESRRAQLTRCICPGCYETVIYAGGPGSIQRAHFRHIANLGPDSCKYRVAPGYQSPSLNPSTWFHRPKSLELFLEIRDDSWELELLVPRYDGEYSFSLGSFSVGGFRYDSTEVPVGGKLFPVFPQCEAYEIEVRDHEGQTRNALIPGLDQITLFNVGGDKGRKQERNQTLRWGQIIAVLSKTPLDYTNPPSQLRFKKLKPKNGWHACLLAFPNKAEATLASWAKSILGKQIASPSEYTVGLVQPVGVRRADDRTWLVTRTEVVLAVRSTNKTRSFISVLCTEEGKNHGRQFEFPASGGASQFSLTLTAGCSRISIGDTDLQIEVVSTFPKIPSPRVSVVFHVDGRRIAVPLFSSELQQRLEQVRSGKARLRDFYLPNICELTAIFTDGGKSQRLSLVGAETSPDNAVSVRFAEQVEDWIKRNRGSVALDAGGFGRFLFRSRNSTMTPKGFNLSTEDKRLWLDAAKCRTKSKSTRFLVHERALQSY